MNAFVTSLAVSMDDTFIRELDLDLLETKTVKLHQKIEGDVNCVVWDASIILAKYLETLHHKHTDYFKNLNIIELGAGVGCAGLTAACLGANVTLTDLPEALPLLNLNIETNKTCWNGSDGSAKAICCDWEKEVAFNVSPDIILLADCIYYKKSVQPLVNILKSLATPDTVILLSQELRDTKKQLECWSFFIETVQELFTIQNIPITEQHAQYCSPDIVIMKLIKL